MPENRERNSRAGLVIDILLDVLGQLEGLAGSYLLLARNAVRSEARLAGRRATLTAALLIVFALGMILFSVGCARVISYWIGYIGTGYIVVGSFLWLISIVALYFLLKSKR